MLKVFDGMSNLAKSLSLHAQFTEAESLNTALLAAQEIVLGKLHQQTIETHNNITACKVARRTHITSRMQVARRTHVTSRTRRDAPCRQCHISRFENSHRIRQSVARLCITLHLHYYFFWKACL